MAKFESVPLASISIGERAREEYGDIEELAVDIANLDLLHAIIVDKDYKLIAGHRRFLACEHLGWTHVDVRRFEDLSAGELKALIIEYAENEKRKSFLWHETGKLIKRIHEKCIAEEGPNWSMEKTAKKLNVSRRKVEQHMDVQAGVEEGDVSPNTKEFSIARSQRIRARENRVADLFAANDVTVPGTKDTSYTPVDGILTGDFTEWAPAYRGPRFNLIHCDFPYGIDAGEHTGMNSVIKDKYQDDPDTWKRLCSTFVSHLDNFCAPSAHLIFWFSAKRYCEVWEMLCALPGFTFDSYPLVWHRGDNAGVAPDAQRRPRRLYETAFFGWRDRKLGPKGAQANLIKASSKRMLHPHEKPQDALTHFFSMLVGPDTRLLDPTAGSGSALRAARELGVKEVLGIEIDEGYAERARRSLRRKSDIDYEALMASTTTPHAAK